MKKASIPFVFIFSIIITIVGIGLLLMIYTKSDFTNTLYCNMLYKSGLHFSSSKDSICKERISVEFSKMNKSIDIEHYFHTKTFTLKTTTNKDFYFNLSKYYNILNASMNVSLFPIQKNTFYDYEDDNEKKSEEYYLPHTHRYTEFYIKLPKNAYLKSGQIGLKTKTMPAMVDIAFVFDTSPTAQSFLDTSCQMVGDLINDLKDILDLNLSIYSLGGTNTHGNFHSMPTGDGSGFRCNYNGVNIVVKITDDELNKTGNNYYNKWFNQFISGTNKSFDDFSEAWAVGALYLLDNNKFREEAKKMIISVSDSDPSGGGFHRGGTFGNLFCLKNDTPLTGDEQVFVNNLITRLNESGVIFHQVIMPFSSLEGYCVDYQSPTLCCMHTNVSKDRSTGCVLSQNTSSCPQPTPRSSPRPIPYPYNCTKICMDYIIPWFRNLTSISGGKMINYTTSSDELYNTIKEAIKDRNIENVSVFVNNVLVQNISGEIGNDTYTYIAGQDFYDAVNNYLDNCQPDDEGYCNVPIRVESETSSTLIVGDVKLNYILEISNAELKSDFGRTYIGDLNRNRETTKVDFKEQLSNDLEKCYDIDSFCNLTYYVSGDYSPIRLDDLEIKYEWYDIFGVLLEKILSCWQKSDYGRYTGNYVCDSFDLPNDFFIYDKITEEMITHYIISNKKCNVIANTKDEVGKTYKCGRTDDLKIVDLTNDKRHILIEYNGEKQQVVVN